MQGFCAHCGNADRYCICIAAPAHGGTIRPPARLEPITGYGNGNPTIPVNDPRQCPKCRLIHLTPVCPGNASGVAFSLAEGYHKAPCGPLEAPSGEAMTAGCRIVQGRTGGTLEGLYRTPNGTQWALVEWDGGVRSLIEPEKLRVPPPVERPQHVVFNGCTYPVNNSADLHRLTLDVGPLSGGSIRLPVFYSDTNEPVGGLFGHVKIGG